VGMTHPILFFIAIAFFLAKGKRRSLFFVEGEEAIAFFVKKEKAITLELDIFQS
jgi:hypothetical protein